jgi:hypothetical protein
MNGRKAVMGLAVLCALVFSAFAASSASANQAYTCQPVTGQVGTVGFSDAHCLTAATGLNVTHEHVLITENTNITGTNANTAEGTTAARVSKLRGTAAGVETEVQCTTVGGSGTMKNEATWAEGTGTINYSGCSVSKPAGKGCVVSGGAVNTKELFATTKGLTNELEFTPKEGTEFASITITSCSVSGLNNTFPVTGSIKGVTSGATTTSTHTETTAQNTLKFAGQKAGLDGAITIKDLTNGRGIAVT